MWAITLVANGVVTQLPTGLSTIDTLAGAVLDFSGNLYVADASSNEIIEIAANGVTTSVLSITGLGSPGLVSPTGLAIDSSGNLYIADTGNSRIIKVSPAGAASVISTSSITLNAPQGVAIDVSGNIFISDTGNSRIIKIPAGGTAAVFTISSLSPVLSNQRGIAVDPLGNLYIADTGNSRVVKVSSTGAAGTPLTTVAGTALDGPSGVAVGNNGMLYIADTNTTEFNPTPGRVVLVDSQGNSSELLTSYPVFNSPRAVAISPMGNLYVVDNGGTANAGRVQSFQSYLINYSDPFVSSVGFGHVQLGSAGTSITIPFAVGMGITLSSIGVYTAGTPNLDYTIANDSTCVTGSVYSQNTDCTIDVNFSPTAAGLRNGALVVSTSSYSLTVPLYGTADAPVVAISPAVASVLNIGSTPLSSPFQTAVDGAGNIYVTNYGGNTVTRIPAGGGSGTTVNTGSFTLSQPTGVAVDATGNLFIADYGNSRIIKVSTAGVASLFAISGLSQSIDLPTALSFDSAGNLYITDYDRGRMVEVNPYGQGTVLASGSVSFAMTSITGSTVDTVGNVYIADRTSSRIVKIDPLGTATILSFSSVGALSSPEGVAVDPSGNIYVMDSSNLRIIRITATGVTSVIPFSGVTIGSFIFGITLDSNGNILVADWSNNRLVKVNVGQSALTYATTNMGSTSSDSPKAATVTDLGDQALVLSANPAYTPSFSASSSDPNPTLNAVCTSSTSLSAGTSCDIPINFTPQTTGSLSANITVTDNTLNVASSTQQIAASGTSINPGDSTNTALAFTPTAAVYQQPVTMVATLTDTTTGHTANVPTGSVSFTDLVGTTITTLSSGVTLNAAGNATLTGVVLHGLGTHSVIATYSGVTGSYLTSNRTSTIALGKAPVTITGPSSTVSVSTGQAGLIPVTITVPYAGGSAPTGTISYSILNSQNVSVSSGTASFTAANGGFTAAVPVAGTLASGPYTVTISYAGDGNYSAPSAPTTVSLTIGTVATTVSLTASANPSPALGAVTLMATISASSGTPTGTVSFYDGATLLATVTVSSGTASYTTAGLAAGSHSITATYSGNTNYSGGTSTAVVLVVQKITATNSLTASASAATPSSPVTFTDTVSSTGGTPTGSVSFYDGTTLLAAVTLSSGHASYTTAALAPGSHSITAVYSGDSNFLASTSAAVVLAVNQITPTIAIAANLNPAILTSAVTFTATVSSSGGTPAGSVSFYDGTTVLGTVTLASGTAVYTTASLASGTHTITAVYLGNSTFQAVTSAAVAELVQDFTISTPTTNAPSATVVPGGTATYTLSIGPSLGTVFPAPVSLSLSGLPPGATGTLSPQILPAGSSLSTVTLTIQLPQQTAAFHRSLGWLTPAMALLLLPFAGKLRRGGKALQRHGLVWILLVAGAGATAGLMGCGAKDTGFFGQTAQTYHVVITATSGSLSHSTSVTLTVQ